MEIVYLFTGVSHTETSSVNLRWYLQILNVWWNTPAPHACVLVFSGFEITIISRKTTN